MLDTDIVSQNIVLLRKQKGLTQQELADKINYSDKVISKWERGESLPDISALSVLSDFFGITLDAITKKINFNGEKAEAVNISQAADANPQPQVLEAQNQAPISLKNKSTAGFLSLFVGFGICNFYLGYKKKAIIQVVLSVISILVVASAPFFILADSINTNTLLYFIPVFVIPFWASVLWHFIEGIMIFTGRIKTDGKGQPLL